MELTECVSAVIVISCCLEMTIGATVFTPRFYCFFIITSPDNCHIFSYLFRALVITASGSNLTRTVTVSAALRLALKTNVTDVISIGSPRPSQKVDVTSLLPVDPAEKGATSLSKTMVLAEADVCRNMDLLSVHSARTLFLLVTP